MADQAVTRDWLKALGTLVAGSLPANESRAKLNLLAPMLAEEFPAGAFTPPSLAAVARQCKFFPSYAEICEVLSPWWKEHRPPHRAIAADQNATIRQREIEREVSESWDGIRPNKSAQSPSPHQQSNARHVRAFPCHRCR